MKSCCVDSQQDFLFVCCKSTAEKASSTKSVRIFCRCKNGQAYRAISMRFFSLFWPVRRMDIACWYWHCEVFEVDVSPSNAAQASVSFQYKSVGRFARLLIGFENTMCLSIRSILPLRTPRRGNNFTFHPSHA